MKAKKGNRKSMEVKAQEKSGFFNKSKQAAFFPGNAQAKLNISKPGDKFEKQADKMADSIVSSPSKNSIQKKDDSNLNIMKAEEEMQTKIMRAEEEEAQTQVMKAEEEEAQTQIMKAEEEDVQTKLNTSNNNSNLELSIKEAKTGGSPLPVELQEEMESHFKFDLSKVRIHTDDEAISLCQQLNAQAFTSGFHIFFNKGKYQPSTASGKHLIAHELTHVVQQNS